MFDEEEVKKKSKEWVYATAGIPAVFDYFCVFRNEASYVKDERGYNAVLSYQHYYQTKQDRFKIIGKLKPEWFHRH